MAAVDTEEPKIHPQNLRRKRKKERLIKQGYRRSERDDARRVAARAFLLGIPLDRHLQRRTGATTSETSIAPRSPGPLSVSSKQSRNMLGEGTSVQTGPSVSELSGRLQDMLDTLPQRNPSPSKGLERQFDTPIPPYPLLASRSLLSFDSHELMQTPAHRRQQYGHTKWHTVASEPSTPGVHVHVQYGFPPLELLGSSRCVFTIPAGYSKTKTLILFLLSRLVFVARRLHGCTPFAIHSVLPYNKFRFSPRTALSIFIPRCPSQPLLCTLTSKGCIGCLGMKHWWFICCHSPAGWNIPDHEKELARGQPVYLCSLNWTGLSWVTATLSVLCSHSLHNA